MARKEGGIEQFVRQQRGWQNHFREQHILDVFNTGSWYECPQRPPVWDEPDAHSARQSNRSCRAPGSNFSLGLGSNPYISLSNTSS